MRRRCGKAFCGLSGLRRRSPRERELIAAAKRRLDTLSFYPRPVDVRHVRVVSAPWFFRIPGLRRFRGFDLGPLILVRMPLDETPEDLVVHELTHAWQVQHRLLRLWLSYVVQGYRDNEHEVQAREAVRRTTAVP
jgi:hypothetical protein